MAYDRNGYDRYGYNREGYNKNGYDKNGYDVNGVNAKGVHRETELEKLRKEQKQLLEQLQNIEKSIEELEPTSQAEI